MKMKTATALTMALGLITITLTNITGDAASPPATEPDAKAISLVKAALQLANPTNPKTAHIHAEGNLWLHNLGLNPEQPTRTQRLSADWKVDFQSRRFFQRSASYLGKELMWCTELVASREMRYQLFCHSNVFSNSGPPQTDGSWFYRMDTTYPDPHWHLAHALEKSTSLHWEGQSMVAGQREDVISYSDEFKTNYRLFLNSATHLLREVSTDAQLTRFQEGFMPRIVFENYRRNGRYWNPTKVTAGAQRGVHQAAVRPTPGGAAKIRATPPEYPAQSRRRAHEERGSQHRRQLPGGHGARGRPGRVQHVSRACWRRAGGLSAQRNLLRL